MAKNQMDFVFVPTRDSADLYEGDRVGVQGLMIYSEQEDNFGRKYWMEIETIGTETNVGAVVGALLGALAKPRSEKKR